MKLKTASTRYGWLNVAATRSSFGIAGARKVGRKARIEGIMMAPFLALTGLRRRGAKFSFGHSLRSCRWNLRLRQRLGELIASQSASHRRREAKSLKIVKTERLLSSCQEDGEKISEEKPQGD
jgi:hypothetical protein